MTVFTLRLHAVGPIIMGGLIAWPAEEAPQVLARYRDVTSEVGRELTLATTMRLAPPVPFVPKEWHGKPISEDRVRAAYRDNFARLATVKAKYDPENLFRSNKNIAPTRGSDPA